MEKHATDEGDRIALRACNGNYLCAKAPSSKSDALAPVLASSHNLGDDELFGVVRAGGGTEAVAGVRLGKPSREEREEAWAEEELARQQAVARSQAVRMMKSLSPPLSKVAHIGSHPFTARAGRAPLLALLPRVMSDSGEDVGALLSNLSFLAAKGKIFGVPHLVADLSAYGGDFGEAMKLFLLTPEGDAAAVGGTLIQCLSDRRSPSMSSLLHRALERAQSAAEASLKQAQEAAGGGLDIVGAMRAKETLEAHAEAGSTGLLRHKEQVSTALQKLDERIKIMREFPDEVMKKFCQMGHLTSPETALAFGALANGLGSCQIAALPAYPMRLRLLVVPLLDF